MHLSVVNDAGPEGRQAVALRVSADRTAFLNVSVRGYQDSLYLRSGRVYMLRCLVAGTVDFIFGGATAVIHQSVIEVMRSPTVDTTILTAGTGLSRLRPSAAGRGLAGRGGLVVLNCTVVAHGGRVWLGRPWDETAVSVFVNTVLPKVGGRVRSHYMCANKSHVRGGFMP